MSALSPQIKIPSAGADYTTFANHLGVDVAGAPHGSSAALGTAHSEAMRRPVARWAICSICSAGPPLPAAASTEPNPPSGTLLRAAALS